MTTDDKPTKGKGHGDRSRLEEQAIVALLTEPTLERAAKKAQISLSTLWRWLQTEAFQARYQLARRQAFEQAMVRLQNVATEAVDTLQRNLSCEDPNVQVRAALGILGRASQAAECAALEDRIRQLEGRLTPQAKEASRAATA